MWNECLEWSKGFAASRSHFIVQGDWPENALLCNCKGVITRSVDRLGFRKRFSY